MIKNIKAAYMLCSLAYYRLKLLFLHLYRVNMWQESNVIQQGKHL